MRKLGGWLFRWLLAVLATAAVGSIVQSQFNLAAIRQWGAPVGFGERLQVTFQDLIGFAPLWAVLVGVALLLAFLLAQALLRLGPGMAAWLYPVAGLLAVAALIGLLHVALPMTPIAATRTLAGSVFMALPGLLGGWIFVRLSETPSGQAA
ncbi:hypothetical protein J2T60_000260 [Natronospira proteinivora]|uniref:Uncharacterized protein n=1 Tax=Natronospira proteinivora TaxID=1807133 RepID=A0ABT1G5S7_9GAMM|nr:hypothetical protein [Natronospira proteinivora]MCP1726295.1 hypothetical protein [Natronospira proteinivora]